MQKMIDFVEKYTTLTDSEKDIIRKSSSIKNIAKSTTLKHVGQDTIESYFVLSGCVYAALYNEDSLLVVDFFLCGDPIILPEPSTNYGLIALEDTQLAATLSDQIENIILKVPKFEKVCRKFAEENLSQRALFYDSLRKLSPVKKYIYLHQHRRLWLERVPQKLIASFLDITPETLSRVRSKIVNEKIDLSKPVITM